MVDVVIRRAETRDIPQLGELGALLVEVHHGFDEQRFLAPTTGINQGYARFLGSQLQNSDAVIYVAEVPTTEDTGSQNIVGYVYAAVEPHSWKELRDTAGFIHDLVVRSEARGERIGTRLLEAASAWLQQRGVPRIMLWTAEKNPGAQKLFERLGFRRTLVEMTREV